MKKGKTSAKQILLMACAWQSLATVQTIFAQQPDAGTPHITAQPTEFSAWLSVPDMPAEMKRWITLRMDAKNNPGEACHGYKFSYRVAGSGVTNVMRDSLTLNNLKDCDGNEIAAAYAVERFSKAKNEGDTARLEIKITPESVTSVLPPTFEGAIVMQNEQGEQRVALSGDFGIPYYEPHPAQPVAPPNRADENALCAKPVGYDFRIAEKEGESSYIGIHYMVEGTNFVRIGTSSFEADYIGAANAEEVAQWRPYSYGIGASMWGHGAAPFTKDRRFAIFKFHVFTNNITQLAPPAVKGRFRMRTASEQRTRTVKFEQSKIETKKIGPYLVFCETTLPGEARHKSYDDKPKFIVHARGNPDDLETLTLNIGDKKLRTHEYSSSSGAITQYPPMNPKDASFRKTRSTLAPPGHPAYRKDPDAWDMAFRFKPFDDDTFSVSISYWIDAEETTVVEFSSAELLKPTLPAAD